jgi:hypothetical protein
MTTSRATIVSLWLWVAGYSLGARNGNTILSQWSDDAF